MRTKEEILDTIDGLGGALFREERTANIAKGVGDVAPGAAFIEAMKPFAEAMLDLRDLLDARAWEDSSKMIRAFIEGQLRLQKKDADWKATIVSRLLAEIRIAGQRASHLYLCGLCDKEITSGPPWRCDACKEKADDAERNEGSPRGDGRPDQDPHEAGPGA